MTINLDISDDFISLVDNPESVIVTLNRAGEATEVSVSNAMRAPLNQGLQQVDGFSFTAGSKATWGVPDKQLNPTGTEGREVMADDTITVAGTPSVVFSVVSAMLVTLGNSRSYWQCVCSQRL